MVLLSSGQGAKRIKESSRVEECFHASSRPNLRSTGHWGGAAVVLAATESFLMLCVLLLLCSFSPLLLCSFSPLLLCFGINRVFSDALCPAAPFLGRDLKTWWQKIAIWCNSSNFLFYLLFVIWKFLILHMHQKSLITPKYNESVSWKFATEQFPHDHKNKDNHSLQ